MARSPLLLAYDGNCDLCARMMDWVQVRDRLGLVVAFPLQNPELVRVAPELAGRPLDTEIHGIDLGTRQVWKGAGLLRPLAQRLPGWRWLAPLLRLPGIPGFAQWVYLKFSERRFRRCGRRPFER